MRVIDRDFRPWFVAADVCRALEITSLADAVGALDEDEKDTSSADPLEEHQELVLVSESGLYALIFKSQNRLATKFRRWVTAEVLPSLRQTGCYVMQGSIGAGRRPWIEWPLEELRVKTAAVNAASKVFNRQTAAWMWVQFGLPTPPSLLLPAWWQAELPKLNPPA